MLLGAFSSSSSSYYPGFRRYAAVSCRTPDADDPRCSNARPSYCGTLTTIFADDFALLLSVVSANVLSTLSLLPPKRGHENGKINRDETVNSGCRRARTYISVVSDRRSDSTHVLTSEPEQKDLKSSLPR